MTSSVSQVCDKIAYLGMLFLKIPFQARLILHSVNACCCLIGTNNPKHKSRKTKGKKSGYPRYVNNKNLGKKQIHFPTRLSRWLSYVLELKEGKARRHPLLVIAMPQVQPYAEQ